MKVQIKVALLSLFIGFVACKVGQKVLGIRYQSCIQAAVSKAATVNEAMEAFESARTACLPNRVVMFLFY